MDTMTEQKTGALARVEELRHLRAVAAVDGGEFDDDVLVAAERDLDRITDVEGLLARREREKQAAAVAAYRAEQRAKLAKAEKHRLAAVERAEDAARALALAWKHCREHVEEMASISHALGVAMPPNLGVFETERRLSQRFMDAMTSTIGRKNEYGHLRFESVPHYAKGDWKQGEASLFKPFIEAITAGEKA